LTPADRKALTQQRALYAYELAQLNVEMRPLRIRADELREAIAGIDEALLFEEPTCPQNA
jgi:hypothetical protein